MVTNPPLILVSASRGAVESSGRRLAFNPQSLQKPFICNGEKRVFPKSRASDGRRVGGGDTSHKSGTTAGRPSTSSPDATQRIWAQHCKVLLGQKRSFGSEDLHLPLESKEVCEHFRRNFSIPFSHLLPFRNSVGQKLMAELFIYGK